MLSYRHLYHAGNFADVLKHSVLIQLLEHLKKKEKSFCYMDTHAGAGLYSLKSEYAEKTQEYRQGIGALWELNNPPPMIEAYLDVIKAFNISGILESYPGSPVIAQYLSRRQDQLFLYELHNTEIKRLSSVVAKDKRVHLHHRDGFEYCFGIMPPVQRRGVVLIDPSYEIKTDYTRVIDTLILLYKRFSTGIYVIWYPVVQRARINEMEQKIQKSPLKNVQLFELSQLVDSNKRGMTASGLIVVNPPWTLKSEMGKTLPYLAKYIGLVEQGGYRIQQLKDE